MTQVKRVAPSLPARQKCAKACTTNCHAPIQTPKPAPATDAVGGEKGARATQGMPTAQDQRVAQEEAAAQGEACAGARALPLL